MKIARFDLWVGVDQACPSADIYAWLLREDGSTLAPYWWDHYAQPNAPAVLKTYFDPPAILLPDEALILQTLGSSTYHMDCLGFITCQV